MPTQSLEQYERVMAKVLAVQSAVCEFFVEPNGKALFAKYSTHGCKMWANRRATESTLSL